MKSKCVELIRIQILVIIYSLVGVFSKIASGILVNSGLFSIDFIAILFCIGLILGIYAIAWQILIKKMELSVAYINKSLGTFWSLLWSVILFRERITVSQIIGALIITAGILMVLNYDK